MNFWDLYCLNAEVMGKEFAEKWCDKTKCATCNIHLNAGIKLSFRKTMTKAFAGKDAFEKAMWHRYNRNEDVMVVMKGEHGEGMSGGAIKLAEQFNRCFDKKRKSNREAPEDKRGNYLSSM